MKNSNKQYPIVVLFGRTNVGKSTLFNRLTEKKQALVSDIEGTTRDSNLGEVEWGEKKFRLVDTGGLTDLNLLLGKRTKGAQPEDVEKKVQQQALDYLKKAEVVLFLVDAKIGLMPQDKQIAIRLKKIFPDIEKKIILVANKADSFKQRSRASEFYELSLGEPISVSAANGSGTGDLLDIIVKKIKSRKIKSVRVEAAEEGEEKKPELKPIKICIIGKPNVGKSSLLNSILGYERVIVSSTPHTTREPQDTDIDYKGNVIKLIDTAGISKRGMKTKGLEKPGIAKTFGALAKSNIAIFMLDISEEITHQDAEIISEILDRKISFIIAANKWDKVPERDTKKFTNYIHGELPFVLFAPIQFISAKTGEKAGKILDLALQINEERQKKLGDSQLDKFISKIVKIHRPSKGKGVRHPRIYEFRQTRIAPPKFELRIGFHEDLHFSYVRFIENRLREQFGFLGTPISIKIVKGRS